MTLTLKFDLLLKNFNLGHNFLTRGDRLSYCTCVLLVTRPFTWYHNFWPSDLDLGSLTFFWKTLNLVMTFKPEVIGLSYCTCVVLVTRPLTWYHNFCTCDLDLEVWPTFEKLLPRLLFNDGLPPGEHPCLLTTLIWEHGPWCANLEFSGVLLKIGNF